MAHRGTVLVGAVALVLVGGLGLLLWPKAESKDYRIARGTVLQSAHCGPPDARDLLHVELLDGRVTQAWLDGCGNRPGELLTVEVPDPLPLGEVTARLAGTGVSATTAAVQRLSAILAAIAGLAGALLAWRLRQVAESGG